MFFTGLSSFCWCGRTEPGCSCTSHCGLSCSELRILTLLNSTSQAFWPTNVRLDYRKGHWQMTGGRRKKTGRLFPFVFVRIWPCLHPAPKYSSTMASTPTHSDESSLVFPGSLLYQLPTAFCLRVPLPPICSLDLTQTPAASFFIKVSSSEARTGGRNL